jgi:hypothetical protein
MAFDISNKPYSDAAIIRSVYDESSNSLKVTSSGGGGSVPVIQELFFDDGSSSLFIRNYVYNDDGTFDSYFDTDIEGAAYTVLGSITQIDELAYYEQQIVANAVVAGVNETAFHDYTTPVTTAAYTELIASTSAAIKRLEIFDSSGQLLVLALGAAASEVDLLYILPGGNGQITQEIPAGTRVSIKAVSANATTGYIAINCYA